MIKEKIYFKECMQQWLKDGEYVFLARQRTSGYIEDAFSAFGKLEVRTHTVWSFLGDPRDIGFDGVYYASVKASINMLSETSGKRFCVTKSSVPSMLTHTMKLS